MKKSILIAAMFMLFGVSMSYSQVFVGDVNINELGIKYVQLIAARASKFGGDIKAYYVDYGQEIKLKDVDKIKDADSKFIEFKSPMAALNYMYSKGWRYVNLFGTEIGNKLCQVYLLEKKE